MPTYKSYCWSLGTTSFRMVEFNRKIEKQLEFLRDFWANPAFFQISRGLKMNHSADCVLRISQRKRLH